MGKSKQITLAWPLGGCSEHGSYHKQWMDNEIRLPTTVDSLNVRTWDHTTGRMRGASRPGISKYVAAQLSGTNDIQHINHVAYSVAEGTSQSLRSIAAVAVSQGTVKSFTSAGFTLATNGTSALDATTVYLDSAELFGVLYFADGTNYKKWTASTNTVAAWTASAGTIPANGSNKPRLICQWPSRIVLSGIIGDEHNWFMSKVGDATDWNYAASTYTDAVAGNNAEAGKRHDIVNTVIPCGDDLLLFGCDHSIWQMTGDPAAGGVFDNISQTIGMAFGKPWCKDSSGVIYFLGSRGGLFAMTPGALPVRISDKSLEKRLADEVNLTTDVVRLEWDDYSQHVLIFITPTSGSTVDHYVFDVRHGALWPESFATQAHNPICTHILDGDAPADRVILLGCQDGYIRKIDYAADDDDGVAIESWVLLGPIIQSSGERFRLDELRIDLGESSSDITYDVFVGNSADIAESSTAFMSGTWTSTKQYPERRRASGRAMYLQLINETLGRKWQFEQATAVIKSMGRSAGR